MKQYFTAAMLVTGLFAGSANAASIITHQSTTWLASSNNGGTNSFNISVESSYQGYYGLYDGNGTAPAEVTDSAFNNDIVAYRFWRNPTNTTIGTLTQSGTIIGDLTTTDASFQGQSALKLWETAASNGNAFDTAANFTSGTNIGNLDQGASGSIDITGMSAGSVYFIYGAYRSTATFNVKMGDVESNDLGNLHNGDYANNNEYYIARVDFVNEGDETSIDWTLANGFNGRFSGIVVTAVPEPGSIALLGLGGLCVMSRRRR